VMTQRFEALFQGMAPPPTLPMQPAAGGGHAD
jgi:hypothetical protein